MSKDSNSFISIGFPGTLTILFIALKLCNVIAWSWWWVTSPTWIYFTLVVILAFIDAYYEAKKERLMEEYRKRHPEKKSKFMERLDEAMKASEERRKVKEN